MEETHETQDKAETPPGREIVRADPRLRLTAMLAALVMVAAGLAGLHRLRAEFRRIDRLAEEDLPAAIDRMLRVTAAAAAAGGAGFVGMAAWLGWLARRVRRDDRYPPQGVKTIKDVRVRAGAEARRMARAATACALFCLVVGTLGMWYFYHLAERVLRG
jgi:hypothetical protein